MISSYKLHLMKNEENYIQRKFYTRLFIHFSTTFVFSYVKQVSEVLTCSTDRETRPQNFGKETYWKAIILKVLTRIVKLC